MSSEISASVGRWEKGARNLQDDVRSVQRLLKTAAEILEAPEIDPKGVDGKISRQSATSDTVEAIEAFQSRFTSAVDGIIAPGSQTLATLLGVAAKVPTAPENVLDVSQWSGFAFVRREYWQQNNCYPHHRPGLPMAMTLPDEPASAPTNHQFFSA